MAATIIDELVVILGLDGSKFDVGKKKLSDDLKKSKDEAESRAKEIQEAGKKAAEFFTRLRNEAIAFFSALVIGKGLEQFVAGIVAGDAAAGRLAHNLDMSTELLTEWEGAVQRAGGEASGFDASVSGLVQQFQQFALTGQSAVIPVFRNLGIAVSDAQGRLRPIQDILLDLADKFSKMDPARATALGRMLGLDQGTINLLEQGRDGVQKLLAEQRQLGTANEADAKRAQAFQKSLLDLRQAATSLGRTILEELLPPVTRILDRMDEWLRKNRAWLAASIVKQMEELGKTIQHTARRFDEGVQSLGGWVRVSEILFGMWAGAKAISFLASLSTLLGFVTKIVALNPLLVAFAAALTGVYTAYKGINDAVDEWNEAEKAQADQDKQLGDGPTKDQVRGTHLNPDQDKQATAAEQYLMQRGFTSEQSIGIVANLVRESGLNPNATGPNGVYGIAQWDAARQKLFRQVMGRDIHGSTFDQQLAFLWWELQWTEKKAADEIRKTHNRAAAAAATSKYYERTDHPEREEAARAKIARGMRPPPISPDLPAAGDKYSSAGQTTNIRSDTRINTINIQTAATDAKGIAASIGQSLRRYSFTYQANTGLA